MGLETCCPGGTSTLPRKMGAGGSPVTKIGCKHSYLGARGPQGL